MRTADGHDIILGVGVGSTVELSGGDDILFALDGHATIDLGDGDDFAAVSLYETYAPDADSIEIAMGEAAEVVGDHLLVRLTPEAAPGSRGDGVAGAVTAESATLTILASLPAQVDGRPPAPVGLDGFSGEVTFNSTYVLDSPFVREEPYVQSSTLTIATTFRYLTSQEGFLLIDVPYLRDVQEEFDYIDPGTGEMWTEVFEETTGYVFGEGIDGEPPHLQLLWFTDLEELELYAGFLAENGNEDGDRPTEPIGRIRGAGLDTMIVDPAYFAALSDGLDLGDLTFGEAETVRDAVRGLDRTFTTLVLGSEGDDTLAGDDDSNELRGEDGDDRLQGRGGDDRLDGGAGDDVLNGGEGRDTLDGGEGTDTATYANARSGVTVSLADPDASADVLSNIERVVGSAHADTLSGGAADDRLLGGGGDDALAGGAGDDALIGGTGADTLDGGTGYDSAVYIRASEGVLLDLTTGARGGEAIGDVLIGIERVRGSLHDDTLIGGTGDDRLLADAGDDVLSGGAGRDALSGGAGADIFAFRPGDARDVVLDFEAGVDRVDLTAFGLSGADALALGEAIEPGVRFALGGGDVLVLRDTSLAALSVDDFV